MLIMQRVSYERMSFRKDFYLMFIKLFLVHHESTLTEIIFSPFLGNRIVEVRIVTKNRHVFYNNSLLYQVMAFVLLVDT